MRPKKKKKKKAKKRNMSESIPLEDSRMQDEQRILEKQIAQVDKSDSLFNDAMKAPDGLAQARDAAFEEQMAGIGRKASEKGSVKQEAPQQQQSQTADARGKDVASEESFELEFTVIGGGQKKVAGASGPQPQEPAQSTDKVPVFNDDEFAFQGLQIDNMSESDF